MKGSGGVVKLLGIILALAGAGFLGYQFLQGRRLSAAAADEVRRQQPEREQCRARLAQLYQALDRYRKEHKGALPPTIEALVPKYLSNPNLLVCPTAAYWIGRKFNMDQGQITVNRRQFPVTYGLRWLTAGYARVARKDPEHAPLIACESHGEAVFKVAYQRMPPLGAFSEEQRAKWVPEVSESRALVLLANGEVVERKPSEI